MSKKNEEQFTMLPYQLMRNKELKDGDKITLAIIYSFYNNDKVCYISNNMLGDMLGISRTAASERITKLETLGYIQCERTMVNGKERRTIVPLRMVSLVGEPNPLVGKPTRTSRSTDPSLVGEVGSIILPSLLDKRLDKELYKEKLSKVVIKSELCRKLNLRTEQFLQHIEDNFSTYLNKQLLEQNKNLIEQYATAE